jgi:Fe-S oxidoreductase
MVTHHFADLFQKEPETLALVHAMEKKVYEFATFLTEVAGVEDVGARMEDVVTYHDGCHAVHGLKMIVEPRELLRGLPGVELVEMYSHHKNGLCCGGGGGVLGSYTDIAGQVAVERLQQAAESGASQVVTSCPTCVVNLKRSVSKAGLDIQVSDIVELLNEAVSAD